MHIVETTHSMYTLRTNGEYVGDIDFGTNCYISVYIVMFLTICGHAGGVHSSSSQCGHIHVVE